MKKKIIPSFLMMCQLFTNNHSFYDLQKEGLEQYQDIYLKGKLLRKASYGERFLEDRFSIVNSILQKYERPFTMLDVGSAQGYFSVKAAELYPESVCVMFEGSNHIYKKISNQVASICKLNNHLNNLIWLDKALCLEDMIKLSTCENFDVILLLNVVHWFPKHWKEIIDTAYSMSHVTILEVPPITKGKCKNDGDVLAEIHRYLSAKATVQLRGVPRHIDPSLYTTYYVLENPGPFVIKKSTVLHPPATKRVYSITNNYQIKTLCKTDVVPPFCEYKSNWKPGINFLTFASLNGKHPSREKIAQALPLSTIHRDWSLNNMVLQGDSLALIDFDDLKNKSAANLYNPIWNQKLIDLVLEKDSEQFEKNFWLLWGIENPPEGF